MQTKPRKKIAILIAEDHPVTIQGVCAIIEKANDMEIVGKVQDGAQIQPMVAKLRPDILLLDLIMPNLSPTALEKWVRENHPETVTIVLTAHNRDAYLANMMEAGISGYLDKKLRAGQLIASIRRAARGEVLFDKKQIERAAQWHRQVREKWESLTKREQDVLMMLTEGADNKTIAQALKVTASTVEKHITNLYKKLGVTSRVEAVAWWFEKGGDFHN